MRSYEQLEIPENDHGKEVEKPSRRDFIKKLAMGGVAIVGAPLLYAGEEETPATKLDESVVDKEQFIIKQVEIIKNIIEDKKYEEFLTNPYLVSCVYYSENFLSEISNSEEPQSTPEKIIKRVINLITPEFRIAIIKWLEKQSQDLENKSKNKVSTDEKLPVLKFNLGKGKGHKDAIDLFTEESSPIYSVSAGLVILSENTWNQNNDISSSSVEGGNTVIVFNYLTNEFFRYAHLKEVNVKPGELIMAGKSIGTVGHTGKNASLPGHGQHLHLEVNRYLSNQNINIALTNKELEIRLKKLK